MGDHVVRAAASRNGRKARELLAGEGRVVVAGGEVRHRPDEHRRAAAPRRATSSASSTSRVPSRPMPGVELDVHARAVGHAVQERAPPGDHVGAGVERDRQLLDRERAHDEDRAVDARRRAGRRASLGRRDRQPVRAAAPAPRARR